MTLMYVEIRKNGKLVARRPVDDHKARIGLRVRLGAAGQVHVAVGKPATLGDLQVQVVEGEPGGAGPEAARAISASPPAGGEATDGKQPAEDTGSMGKLGFSAAGVAEPASQGESLPEIEGYRVLGPIGQGGMGTVWRAEQLSTRREVALKLMTSRGMCTDKAQARFAREVELTARLDHPNIGRIYDSGVCRGACYYAMELIDGMPLDRYVQRMALSTRPILALMRSVCQAVHYAHLHGVIHRDLKPSNIMVSHDGQPHVLDFGLARSFLHEEEAVTISLEGEIAGTPAYMSPEQALGRQEQIDTRTDVFSLGVILYHLLAGRPPHDLSGSVYEVLQRVIEGKITRPRQASAAIDRELEALLLRALATDLESRYASAGELADDIDNYLNGEPLRARLPTTFYFLRKKARKHWRQVSLAAVLVAVVLGTVVAAYTKVVGERAIRRAAQREIALKAQELKMADLRLKILGKDKKEAEAALNLLLDRYTAAEERVSEQNSQLAQPAPAVPARGTDLTRGPPLDAKALVRTPSLPGQVASWTVETKGSRAPVARLRFSPDDRWLASVGEDGVIRLWEMPAGSLAGILIDPNGPAADVGWSDDGLSLMLLDAAGEARWWAWEPPTRTLTPIPASSPQLPRPAPAGRSWSARVEGESPSVDEILRRWDIRLAGDRRTLYRTAVCLALSRDGRTLAFADREGAISLSEGESGSVRSAGAPSWCGPTRAVAFAPRGDLFAMCTGAGTLCLWDAHRWQPLRKFEADTIGGGDSPETGVFCWGPDGDVLARAGGPGGAVEIMDVASGRILRRLKGSDQRITSLAWPADGGTLAAGTGNGMLLAWDLASTAPEPYRQLPVGGANVRAAFLNADPPGVVTASSDGKVALWDLREGRLLRTFPGSPGAAVGVAATPDGKTIACAGPQAVYLWDAATGALPRTLKIDPNRPASDSWVFSALAWSPEDRTLAAGDSAGRISVWDADARAAARSFATHGGAVTSLAWSRAGQLLLSGGSDGTARAWDVKNGFREYAVLLPLWGSLGAGIAINPEGDYRGPPQIDDHLVYVVRNDQGCRTLTPTEFRTQHGWVNEPWQVGLYRPGAEPMQRIYVKTDAPGPFDGRSWETAFRDLQDALSAARPDTEIWVAAGVYTPDRGTGARTASFHLKDRVRLFGGFAGTETRVHERDPNRYETILSGDLNGDDGPQFTGNEENSHHVVMCQGVGPNTVLDGCTITGGNANGPRETEYAQGGGLFSGGQGGMTLIRCTFVSNSADRIGGGVRHGWADTMSLTACRFLDNRVTSGSGGGFINIGASARLRRCLFQGNSATQGSGGGLHNQGVRCLVAVQGCRFRHNTARRDGGAIYGGDNSALSVSESDFEANTSESNGGAIYQLSQAGYLSVIACRFIKNVSNGEGGGVCLDGSYDSVNRTMNCLFVGNEAGGYGGGMDATDSDLTISGCLFTGNKAAGGGGLCIWACEKGNKVVVTNCTLVANSARGQGGGFFNRAGATVLANCIVWQNTVTEATSESTQVHATAARISHSCVQGWTVGVGGINNLGVEPLFRDLSGPDGRMGTADDNLRLQPGSPCRDAGNDSVLPADAFDLDADGDPNEPIPCDLAGQPRIQNGRVDLGAYESEAVSLDVGP